jgi:hypothetical protein
MITAEQQMTLERRGYTELTWQVVEDGAILILSRGVVIDRWGGETRHDKPVGGA